MKRANRNETGIALIVTLLLTFVFTLMTLGFFFMVTGEQKIATSDRDSGIAYYAAQAGLEKMSAELVSLFARYSAPTIAQVDNLWNCTGCVPTVPGVKFASYQITYPTIPGTPPRLKSTVQQIGGSGPLSGLQGVMTPFTLVVSADSVNGPEVKLTRQVQEVAVPVFQFGIFSDNDLSFFAGPPFSFGGRVHTNGNLFLDEGDASTGLTLSDKVTAYKQVIRTQLSNTMAASPGWAGLVNVATGPGSTSPLDMTQGSLTGGPGSTPNTNWPTISLTTHNGYIKTKATGAKKLNLTFALPGAFGSGSPIDMIRRAPVGESVTSNLGAARFFNQAAFRILISDSPTTPVTILTGLPGVTSTAPYPLDESLIDRNPAHSTYPNYLPAVNSCHPPFAQSRGYLLDNDYMSLTPKSLLAGRATSYIKMEIQTAPGTWTDVTKEILKLGIVDVTGWPGCTNKSIIHLEKTATPGSITATDYIPINMYDPREGDQRDTVGTDLAMGGIMNVVELDVHNLQLWFANTLDSVNAPSGALAQNVSGYIAYFSDRRSNYCSSGCAPYSPGETGEYGFEDIINPTDPLGAPNGVLDQAEDVNGNGILDVYGKTPQISFTPAGTWLAVFAASPTPTYRLTSSQAKKNGVVFFRRALRLVNGVAGNLPPLAHANCTNLTAGGFTVAAENPVYVWGDYNADPTNGFSDTASACHVPAAVMGDAVTVLSDTYSDSNMDAGDNMGCGSSQRCASTTYYRMAIVAGKNNAFTLPGWSTQQDFGTDGGVHNFVRYIEDWGSATLNYTGSLLSFYYARQAVGVYKCCTVVYSPPTRNYSFDTDFTNINTIPPGTPRFSDVNALSYKQSILPSQ